MRLDFFIELKRRHVYRVAVAYAVVGWLLIEFCTQVFPVLHMPEWTEQLVVLLILFGFPLTLMLAWAFELTPEGVRRTEPSHSPKARSHEDHRRVGRMLDFTIIGVLLLALVVALWRPWLHPTAMQAVPAKSDAMDTRPSVYPLHRHSIAVMPFTNNSEDPDQRYFSDGLSESLIDTLTQYPALTVIARRSSFTLRNANLDSQQIGKRLGVAYLLEGSVSHAGNVVRVRADLVDTTDGHNVWSHTYDRTFDNLFALQDAITMSVANALEVKLLRPVQIGAVAQTNRPPSGNIDAYNAFLQGNFYLQSGGEISWRKAIDAYQRAIDADPRYAAAYAMLSVAWTNLVSSHDLGQGSGQAYEHARSAADTAVALDGNLARAYVARGWLYESRLELKLAKADYQHALMLEPSSPYAMGGVSSMQAVFGDLDSAIRLIRDAIRHDPLESLSYIQLAKYLAQRGRYDDALDAVARAISLRPTSRMQFLVAELQLLRGHAEEAVRVGKSVTEKDSRMWIMALAAPAAGDPVAGDQALHWIIDRHGSVMAYQVAQVYAFRKDAGRTFQWLDRAWRQRDPGMSELAYDPLFKSYYRDPRFAEICHKLGVPVPASEP